MGIEDLSRQAREIRLRLYSPPNSVPDHGIDLKRRSQSVSCANTPDKEEFQPEPPRAVILPFPIAGRWVSIQRVISLVAKHSGYTVAEITGTSRKKDLSLARHVAIYLCFKNMKVSYSRLGISFNKDHTTIMHGRGRIVRWLGTPALASTPDAARIRHLVAAVEQDLNVGDSHC